jgi:hypothetical protein
MVHHQSAKWNRAAFYTNALTSLNKRYFGNVSNAAWAAVAASVLG